MSTLIKSGRIVTADQDYTADIYIDGGKIARVGADLHVAADAVFDARGKYVIPGGIDVHTHMDMPYGAITSSDDFETGTRAAAFGGTTCIIDFATQSRGRRMREALDEWWKKGEKAAVDYGLHMIVTDLPEAHLEDMDEMVREGVTSFKFFMAYPDLLMVDDATILRAMRRTGANGALVCIHAENGGVIDLLVRKALAEGKKAPVYHALTRPASAEAEAVGQALRLALADEAVGRAEFRSAFVQAPELVEVLFGAAADLLLVGFLQAAAGDGQLAAELVEECADEALALGWRNCGD